MISANELRNRKFSPEQNGYNVDEVSTALNEAADTIDGYVNESKELYRKMEVLAKKIEEYREEEDSIKSALITAQKMADKLEKESKETAETLINESKETAQSRIDAANSQAEKTVNEANENAQNTINQANEEAEKTIREANEKAEQTISEAREFSANLIQEKTDEAESIIADARKKANDAINSSKIVAEDILSQSKQISEDLIGKSKQEAEAYKILAKTVKGDAKGLIAKLISLYSEQLEVLKNANLETSQEEEEEEVENIHSEVDSLVNEIKEVQSSIPDELVIEDEEEKDEADFQEIEEIEEVEEIEEEDEEPQDPMKAVEAFSADELTPIEGASPIPEIEEDAEMEGEEDERSLFDEEDSPQPFESFFNVNNEDPHLDRTKTISLVPPEDEENSDSGSEPKFKGFFKKKK
ncbi:MAG: DivIVA domain-containing protein [Eubacterium sp.]|nr:DivIVA domain-containing protein [Eubacterium sp.]